MLFLDLVGSTAFAARLDPEGMKLVIRAHRSATTEVNRRWGDRVAEYMDERTKRDRP
jgi:hypothetical protein